MAKLELLQTEFYKYNGWTSEIKLSLDLLINRVPRRGGIENIA